MASGVEADASPPPSNVDQQPQQRDEYSRSGKGKFRFKSSSSRSKSKRKEEAGEDRHRRYRHHCRHDGHHRSKRHKTRHNRSPSPSVFPKAPKISPDEAFRESLFDALGDDEGAEYWESIYGQPIHDYDRPSVPNGPNGELEQMTDEEYAAYVRAQMWSRTREGMMEEQERLRAERARHKQKQQNREQETYERTQFDKAMEESLRRGRERRRVKAWKTLWEQYHQSWEDINKEVATGAGTGEPAGSNGERNSSGQKHLRNLLFWPVESGKRRDISREAVEEFMQHAPRSSGESDDSNQLLVTLKSERIRWHPDKIQHRYGALGIDDVVMRSVTEVFQIVDRMWNEAKEKD